MLKMTVQKQILLDENMQPCFVQIAYHDWLKIAKRLHIDDNETSRETGRETDKEASVFMRIGKQLQGTWQHGDGLAFQESLRGEWEQ
jgi:hypothetical protein